ncbi:Amine oxidase [Mycena chlorophos]|uniref:Amine oxidase n=1 Tax=Mycena chlorophos TaxID=658473 RepID=A0A8H6SGJ1_MYCCL|nr:Amine oxidase [Mycena chlorophos]
MEIDKNMGASLPTRNIDASAARHGPETSKDASQPPKTSNTDSDDFTKAPPLLAPSSAAIWDEKVVDLRSHWTQWPSMPFRPVSLDRLKPSGSSRLPLFFPAPTDEVSTIGNDDELPSPLNTAVNSSTNSALHSPSVSSRADDDSEPPRKKRRLQRDESFLHFLDVIATEANADSDSDHEESVTDSDRQFINDEDDGDFEPDHSVVAANPRLFPDIEEGLPDDPDELRAIGEALSAKYTPCLPSRDRTEIDNSVPPVPAGDNRFFIVYTRPKHEYDLLLYLFHTSCVASATAVGLGSGLVVVEIRPGELQWTREHEPVRWAQSKLDWKVVQTTESGPRMIEVLKMSTYKYFCAQLALFATQTLCAWERRGPKPISGFEANLFIRSRCGTSNRIAARLSARWIRFRSGEHAGHLGLLQANPSPDPREMYEWDEILIIPTLRGGPSEEERLCLFDPKRVNAAQVKRRNKTFMWSKRCFTEGGLEVIGLRRVEPVPYEYDVVPRDAELALFRRANVDGQLDLPFSGHTGALQPGDLVVLPADAPWRRSAGLIVAIHEVKTARDETGVVRLSKEVNEECVVDRVRYACVVEPDEDSWCHPHAWKFRLEAAQYYPVHDLRLHLLAFPRRIRAGDRVTSVSPGQMLGISAMVHEVNGPDVVLDHSFAQDDDLAQQGQIQTRLPLRLVFVEFKIGDVVRVIRGPHINKVGFVVAILPAGWIEIYPAEINQGRFILVEAAQTNISETRPAPNPAADCAAVQLDIDMEVAANRLVVEADETPRDAPVILVPGTHIAFEQFDANDYRDHQVRRNGNTLPSATLERQRAKLRREMRKDAVPWLNEIPIRVVGDHHFKGLYGDIKGYSWTVASPSKIANIFERYSKLVVTVALDRIDTGNKREQIPYNNLAHRGSGLPLYTTTLLKSLADTMFFDQRPKLVAPTTLPWVAKYGPPPAMDDILSLRFLINNPLFINKRLDVRVATQREFVDAVNYWRQSGIAQTVRGKDKLCGMEGYLKPLDEPLSEKAWKNMAKIFVGPGQTKYLPYPLIYPRRTVGEFKDHIGTLEHTRVIVIGPTVEGSKEWMGQYGRVVLDEPTEWPTRILRIEFPPQPAKYQNSPSCPRALFYEESLCLALNKRIPGTPDTEVTSWD